MGSLLEQMVQEKRTTVVIGIGRWHLRAIGQEDYSKAQGGTFVLLLPYVTPENAEVFALPNDDQRKLMQSAETIAKMKVEERIQLAQIQRATATAGIEGISEASERCSTVDAIAAEIGNAANVEAMAEAEANWKAAATKETKLAARGRYQDADAKARAYVGARHRCSASCFKTYKAIKFVPREQDENPQAGLIHVTTIPASTIESLFDEIMALSDEGGRARKRIGAFQPSPEADAGQARPPVRPAAKLSRERRQPRGSVP